MTVTPKQDMPGELIAKTVDFLWAHDTDHTGQAQFLDEWQ